MNRRLYLPIGLLLVLGLACQQTSASRATPGADETAEVAASEMPVASEGPAATQAEAGVIATVDGMPPQSSAATLQQPERRAELTRLSGLLDYQVTGFQGSALGQITDYIVNTCETYVIYMLVKPDAALNLPDESRLVIPYEAVTINSGILNAETKAIALSLAPGNLTAAPTVTDPLTLFPIEWEAGARDYWSKVVRVGKLASNCRAGNSSVENAIYKIAYARQLLVAELKDGNGVHLGTVVEAVLAPETGKLGFYVVELPDSQGMVLLPLGKSNIPKEALVPGSTIELVLLADNGQLAGAPRVASVEEANTDAAQNTARAYWGQ